MLLIHIERGWLAWVGLHVESVLAAGLFGGLLGLDELPGLLDRVLDEHLLGFLAGVLDDVALGSRVLVAGEHGSLADADADDGRGLLLDGGSDFGVEIDRVADQSLAAGRQVLDLGVARIGVVVEDGDRPLHEVQIGRVLQAEAVERMLGVRQLVVDRDFVAFHRFVDDRQHGGFAAGKLDGRRDLVAEELADVAGLGDGLDALLEVRACSLSSRDSGEHGNASTATGRAAHACAACRSGLAAPICAASDLRALRRLVLDCAVCTRRHAGTRPP